MQSSPHCGHSVQTEHDPRTLCASRTRLTGTGHVHHSGLQTRSGLQRRSGSLRSPRLLCGLAEHKAPPAHPPHIDHLRAADILEGSLHPRKAGPLTPTKAVGQPSETAPSFSKSVSQRNSTLACAGFRLYKLGKPYPDCVNGRPGQGAGVASVDGAAESFALAAKQEDAMPANLIHGGMQKPRWITGSLFWTLPGFLLCR